MSEPLERERGSVLVIAVVLVTMITVVVLGAARYASTGRRSSTNFERSLEAHRHASAVSSYLVEELTTKRLAPCSGAQMIAVPAALTTGALATAACEPMAPVGGHPTAVYVVVVTASGATVTLRIVVQAPSSHYIASVLEASTT